jgi:sugar phosphate isomerase/epimerase
MYPMEKQKFEINGKPPRDFEVIKKAVYEHWDFDDEGIVHVEKEGGLSPGKHIMEFQQSVLAAYGYLPTDEEWIQNPPVPGSGAGSDKTAVIVTFELELQSPVSKNKKTWSPPSETLSAKSEIQRGVNFYSYQQAQFFKQLDLEGQIREVAENLYGADGIEINESLKGYPNPTEEMVEKWYSWLDKYKVNPVCMDVYMDVLQFRDHVMSYHECAERLKNDLRLADRLGFRKVRTLAVVPIEILMEALPLAEELDIRIGKEIHNPIPLTGKYVQEIVDYVNKTGTKHLGIVPDMGIYQYQPSDVALEWMIRHGASRASTEVLTEACLDRRANKGPLSGFSLSLATAGNIEAGFRKYRKTGDVDPYFKEAFQAVVALTESKIKNPSPMDYEVIFQALLYSGTKPEDIAPLVPYIVHIHGKFFHMTEIPGRPGEYEERAIDYEGPLAYLKKAGYNGYINSEYEGQRRFQDLPFDQLADEVDEVRKHHAMLKRLIDVKRHVKMTQ